ncbi:MAG: metallophosphoesterase [Clostridia bacterium]|nr:metallophosphoesterase [Clostridia bacterium]
MLCEDITIHIPGLTRDYLFYHTSDAHIAWADPEDTQADRDLAEKHAHKWNLSGIFPRDAFDEALRMAKEDHADGIFLCGDICDYFTPSIVSYVEKRLASCGTEPLFVSGNHEGNSYLEVIPDIRIHYADYAHMMHDSPAFWVRDFGEFLVVALDDSDKKVQPEQLDALKRLCQDGRPILLLTHIPVYTREMEAPLKEKWGEDACDYFVIGYGEDEAQTPEFCRLLRDPKTPIVAVFAGHIHLSHKSELAPGRMQYTSAPTFDGKVRRITLTGEP